MVDNQRPLMTCGHSANSMGKRPGDIESRPACVICSCFDVDEEATVLEGRTARCAYYGRPVKTGFYNSNSCNTCKAGELCSCEKPSSTSLWFFQYMPDKEHDEFYCACHGAD